jgi:hypothetical protein
VLTETTTAPGTIVVTVNGKTLGFQPITVTVKVSGFAAPDWKIAVGQDTGPSGKP